MPDQELCADCHRSERKSQRHRNRSTWRAMGFCLSLELSSRPQEVADKEKEETRKLYYWVRATKVVRATLRKRWHRMKAVKDLLCADPFPITLENQSLDQVGVLRCFWI